MAKHSGSVLTTAEEKDMLSRKGAVPSGTKAADHRIPAVAPLHSVTAIVEKAANKGKKKD